MYFHSGRVAAYAVAIALQNAETNSHRLTEIALGCLLHDIGNNKLSPEIMHKPAMLSASEWSEVHKHPEFGHQQILHAVLTTIPREIVLHHHERLDGTGYPHGLSRDQILPEVSIAALADIFDSLISDRPYRPARKPYQALELIKCTMVDSVDQDAFKALVSVFATDFKNSKS
jgi:HD-GYP domain-containing protein (c-di-GMP phosphodiesterase class II)